tara:strand:- start:299 stop:721 length:423 start_codon:yes stop_codon:yes gene_type:complete
MSESDYKSLYNAVLNQNEILEQEITRLNNLYSTNNREAKFTVPKYQWYVRVNFVLWVLYYILVVVCLYYLFFRESERTTTNKILITLAFLVFPMVIFTLEFFVYRIVKYLVVLFSGIPVKREDNNVPPFSVLDIFPPGYY